jgi:hypothetical protein
MPRSCCGELAPWTRNIEGWTCGEAMVGICWNGVQFQRNPAFGGVMFVYINWITYSNISGSCWLFLMREQILVAGATTILRKTHLGMGQTKCYLAGYS